MKLCENAVTEESREEREGKRREKDRHIVQKTEQTAYSYASYVSYVVWVAVRLGVGVRGSVWCEDQRERYDHYPQTQNKTTNTTYHVVGRSR